MGEEQSEHFYDQRLDRVSIPYESSPWRPIYDAVVRLLLEHKDTITSILDVGCGTGRCAEAIRRAGLKEYIGLDFSSARINEAKSYVPEFSTKFKKLEVFSQEALQLFLQHDTFIMTEFLEHVSADLDVIKRVPLNSLLIFSVPNFDSAGHVRHFESAQEVIERYQKLLYFPLIDNPIEISKPKRPNRLTWVFCAFRQPA